MSTHSSAASEAAQQFGVVGDVAVTVKIAPGIVVLVDLADEPLVYSHKWRAVSDSGHLYARAVAVIDGERKSVQLHRLIVGASRGQIVDHINGNGLDNRRANLRICSNRQNCRNSAVHKGKKTSRYKGVSLIRESGKFRASIMCSGVKINLGNYAVEEDAACAYDTAARKLFGAYARTNFPDSAGAA